MFFFYQGFLHRHWRFTGQKGKGGSYLLVHFTTSTHSRTLRHLFATLHVRLLSRIFNHNTWFTRLLLDGIFHLIELPFEWLIDDVIFVCLAAIHKGCPHISGEEGQVKVDKCGQGEGRVVSQIWTSAWKKNYSYHICEMYSDNLAVCLYIKFPFCLYSIENVRSAM